MGSEPRFELGPALQPASALAVGHTAPLSYTLFTQALCTLLMFRTKRGIPLPPKKINSEKFHFFTRIRLSRMAELLALSEAETEDCLSDMVGIKSGSRFMCAVYRLGNRNSTEQKYKL
jgi:hypothetical protein